MKKGNSALMYGTLNSIFYFLKKIFRLRVSFSLSMNQSIYSFSDSSISISTNYLGYWPFNPAFIFFHLLEHGRPAVIISSKLIRGDLRRIPFFFDVDVRAYVKVFRLLKEMIKTKNSLFFLLPQRLLFEIVSIYKNTSSLLILKEAIHEELLTTRPNLRFLHKI